MRFYSFLMLFALGIACMSACADDSPNAFLLQYDVSSELYTMNDRQVIDDATQGVIIIEDMHCNYPIQQTNSKIITSVNTSLKTMTNIQRPIVMQEGGSVGTIDTSVLSADMNPEEKKLFLDDALQKGKVGAAEYLHASGADFYFVGIEDPYLYQRDVGHHCRFESVRSGDRLYRPLSPPALSGRH